MKPTRRDVIKYGAAVALTGCASAPKEPPKPKMPVVYLSHGSPMQAVRKDDYGRALRKMGENLPTPKAIVILSAHWVEDTPIRVTAGEKPELIYDFFNFPDELYQLKYPSPGHPDLAMDVAMRLKGVTEDRGLDHGAWVPMLLAYPAADIPVIEVTIPWPRTPTELLEMGRTLAPLREQGILLVGSGGIVHNLSPDGEPAEWGREFDGWVRSVLERRDVEALLDYEKRAPHADYAVPTTEHFDPIFFVVGAAEGGRVTDLYEGFRGAHLSMRCFALAD